MQIKTIVCCDFCHTQYEHSDENVEKIEEHEKICSRNPINKNCYSCIHFSISYDYPQCAVRKDNHFDIWDDRLPCDKWENK